MWQLLENDHPIPSYKEIVSKWPDGSIKWLHIHGIFVGGKQYSFDKVPTPPTFNYPQIPDDTDLDWEVAGEDGNGLLGEYRCGQANLANIPPDAMD
jgi:hypothetical protein